jgi:hypothetical protein
MKIAFIQEHLLFWNGGVRYLYEVTRRLAKDNEVTVFAGKSSDENYFRFASHGVILNLHSFVFENSIKYWLLYPLYALKNSLALRRTVLGQKYGMVFSNSPSTSIACFLARIKPIIIVFELNPWLYSKEYQQGLTPLKRFIIKFYSPVAKLMEKLAYRNAVKVIVWSKFVQSEVKRVYGVDSEVVYTGIDTEFFKNSEE